jgi:hypothetical protein
VAWQTWLLVEPRRFMLALTAELVRSRNRGRSASGCRRLAVHSENIEFSKFTNLVRFLATPVAGVLNSSTGIVLRGTVLDNPFEKQQWVD